MMNISMHKNKLIFIFYSIFVLFLFWPLYGIVAYAIFPEIINAVAVLLFIFLEIFFGTAIIAFVIRNRKILSRKYFYLVFISVGILFTGYLVSLIWSFIL